MKNIGKFLASALMTIGIQYYINGTEHFAVDTVLNIVLLVAMWFLLGQYEKLQKRAKNYGLWIGLFLAAILLEGKVLYETDSMIPDIKGRVVTVLLEMIGVVMALAVTSGVLLHSLEKAEAHYKKCAFFEKKCFPFVVYFSILLAWFPAYLAAFPGVYGYDIFRQLYAAKVHKFDAMDSIVHDVFVKICVALGEKTNQPFSVFYEPIQLLLIAAVYTLIICYLVRKHVSREYIIFAWIFYAINPAIITFSAMPTKDVFFAGAMSLVILFLLDASAERKEGLKWGMLIAGSVMVLLMMLLRKNGFVAILPTMVLLPFWEKNKKLGLKLAGGMLGAVILLAVIEGPVFSALNISAGPQKETLCVPMQQIARIVAHRQADIPEDLLNEINRYMPAQDVPAIYNSRFADNIKDVFSEEAYVSDKHAFWQVYFKTIRVAPRHAVEAFLELNLPNWYPDAYSVDKYSWRRYIEYLPMDYYGDDDYVLEHCSGDLLPGYFEWLREFSRFKKLTDIPILEMMFSIALPIWVVLAAMAVMLYRKQGRKIYVLFPLFFLWASYELGPVANMRYMYPLYMLYPLLFAIIGSNRLFSNDE